VKKCSGAAIFTAEALGSAVRRAERSAHRETGGLLLGFRAANDVHIVDIIEIRDRSATRNRYLLREKRREQELVRYLADVPSGSPVGYVGTWHSHLADVGPSWIDKQTFRREVWTAPDLVVHAVLARSQEGWHPYVMIGIGRLRIQYPDPIVI